MRQAQAMAGTLPGRTTYSHHTRYVSRDNLPEKGIQNLSLIPADIINDTFSTQMPNNQFKCKFINQGEIDALARTICCSYINTAGRVTMLKEKVTWTSKKTSWPLGHVFISLPAFGNQAPVFRTYYKG